jgi:hypothetical protein
VTDPRMLSQDARTLVMSLGIGDVQATMVIPYMFMTPATTDPDMPPVHMLVRGVQRGLKDIGVPLEIDGVMGVETATYLRKLTGPNWPGMTWYELYQTLTRARATGKRLDPPVPAPARRHTDLGIMDLPDVPGGGVTLALGLGAFWYFFLRERAARR